MFYVSYLMNLASFNAIFRTKV